MERAKGLGIGRPTLNATLRSPAAYGKSYSPPNKKVVQQTKSVNNNAIKHPQTGQEKWVNFFTSKKILLISRKGRATTNWSKMGEGGVWFPEKSGTLIMRWVEFDWKNAII